MFFNEISIGGNVFLLRTSWASERKAYFWCKCVDLTSDTDTDSDKTAVSVLISNGALYEKKSI